MGEVFQFALEHSESQEGMITIMVLFVISSVIALLIKKTTSLNQPQSFIFLTLLFFGLLLFLVIMVSFSHIDSTKSANPTTEKNTTHQERNQTSIQSDKSMKNISDSNITLNRGDGSVEINESFIDIHNSTITF